MMRLCLSAAALSAGLVLSACSVSEAAPAPEVAGDVAAAAPESTSRAQAAQTPNPIFAVRKETVAERPDFVELRGEYTQGGWVRGKAPSDTVALTLDDAPVEIAEDGSFFAAFDRDAGSTATLKATYPGGEYLLQRIEIMPRKWQISRINVNRGRGRNLEAYWKKREPEYNAIVAARAKKTGAQGWKQDFIWPVKGRISGHFGRQRIYRDEAGSYHSGIDIAPGNGVPFVSPADGVVVLARSGFSFEGKLIIIDHGAGLNSAFLHCSKIAVKEGDVVKQGQYIGNVGSTGRSTGPHLHWGVKWGDARFDPILLVGPMK